MGTGIAAHGARPGDRHGHRPLKVLALLGLFLPFLTHCTLNESQLDKVRRIGELRVLTYSSTTTYYETPEGPAGPEYDLAKAFADHLGVRLNMVVVDQFSQVLPHLTQGDADFAAAGIADTE